MLEAADHWAPSRIAAALPSGVGFLGGAVIYKQARNQGHQEVHGLTTATSIWISAALGVASGCGLYFVAIFGTCTVIATLRFGPRSARTVHDEELGATLGEPLLAKPTLSTRA